MFISASAFRYQNVVALIEGSDTKTSACALSSVADIPLIRFHGDSRPSDQCEKTIQMSSDFRDFAHATLDILDTFGWTNIAVVFDGKNSHHLDVSYLEFTILSILKIFGNYSLIMRITSIFLSACSLWYLITISHLTLCIEYIKDISHKVEPHLTRTLS